MREIKFRAWDVRNEVMWLRKPKQLTSEFFQLIEQDTAGGEQFILMQYTGLHDRNGVEIYEGDELADDEFVYQVYFDDADCVFKLKDCDSDMETINRDWTEWFEVVGNIYEKS